MIEQELSFTVPEKLIFENTKLSGNRQLAPRQDKSWQISVSNKAHKNWKLMAQTIDVTTSNHTSYKDALVFVDDKGNEQSLVEKTLIAQGTSNETATTIHWDEGKGVLFAVNPTSMKAATYTGQMNWTLEDTP